MPAHYDPSRSSSETVTKDADPIYTSHRDEPVHKLLEDVEAQENGFNIVYEDDKYIAFKDINPSSEQHIQLVPKEHIESVRSLCADDAVMVKEMVEIGHSILDKYNVPPQFRRLGFHIPPYISVTHLHMHVQALPYSSFLRRLKYPVVSGWWGQSKGFSWFADGEQTIRLLENGIGVRILPC